MKISVRVPDEILKKITETISFQFGKEISEVDIAEYFVQYLIEKGFTQENLDCEAIIVKIKEVEAKTVNKTLEE